MKPVLLVIAGPNGAGKTTLTERLRQDRWSENVEYPNRTRSHAIVSVTGTRPRQ